MKNYTGLILCLLLSSACFAQEEAPVKWNIDPKVESLITKRNEQRKANGTISGYRVQIYLGSSRSEAQDTRQKFAALHPELESYVIYQQPYFKVRVGDFRSRLEAYRIYQAIQKEFGSVFIVNDDIRFPKLPE